MKYKTLEEIDNIPANSLIWACAYETTSSKENMSLKCLPMKGIIGDKRTLFHKFIPFKANGDLKKSAAINVYSRKYADTYEECVTLYNELVQKRIDALKKIENTALEDFI